jgi:hypothetical protein
MFTEKITRSRFRPKGDVTVTLTAGPKPAVEMDRLKARTRPPSPRNEIRG